MGHVHPAKPSPHASALFMGCPSESNKKLPAKTVKDMWPKVCRKLKKRGIFALWVREPNRLNKCYYHILIKNNISMADLKQAI